MRDCPNWMNRMRMAATWVRWRCPGDSACKTGKFGVTDRTECVIIQSASPIFAEKPDNPMQSLDKEVKIMKRSEINAALREMERMVKEYRLLCNEYPAAK